MFLNPKVFSVGTTHPFKSTSGSRGWDIKGMNLQIPDDPNAPIRVGTGVILTWQDKNVSCLVHPRSGIFYRFGVEPFQGLIDMDYGKEIIVLYGSRKAEGVLQDYIDKGNAVAQLIFTPEVKLVQKAIKTIVSTHGGLGSTDRG